MDVLDVNWKASTKFSQKMGSSECHGRTPAGEETNFPHWTSLATNYFMYERNPCFHGFK